MVVRRFRLLLLQMPGAPWTLQRLAELLLEPRRQYTRLHKLVCGCGCGRGAGVLGLGRAAGWYAHSGSSHRQPVMYVPQAMVVAAAGDMQHRGRHW
jgi:hypothetical protein